MNKIEYKYRIIFSLVVSFLTIFFVFIFTLININDNYRFAENFSIYTENQLSDDISVTLRIDRSRTPRGSTLLQNGTGITNGAPMRDGNFQVEGFCPRTGRGNTIREDGIDWYCGNYVITPEDFDQICEWTYGVKAVAIRNGTGSREAYKWRCYSFPENINTPTPIQIFNTPTPTSESPRITITITENPDNIEIKDDYSYLYPPCGPIDCNQDGIINIFDFSCFSRKYGRTCI